MKYLKFDRRWLIPASIVAALAVVATLGFRGVFPDFTFVAPSLIGAIGATAIGLLTRSLRLHVPESILASFVGFVLFGGIATNGLPSGTAYRTFFDGLINDWSRLLTSIPPAALSNAYRVMPYTVAWLSAMVGVEILRSRRTALAVLGPLIGLTLTTLITLEDRQVALAQGAVLAVGMLALGWIQQRRQARDLDVGAGADDRQRVHPRTIGTQVLAAVGLAIVAAIGSIYVAPRLPIARDNERFDLRDLQTPPFDPLNTPTPLGQVKVGLQEANADRVVFKITSDDEIDRVTLAVLDEYNSQYWLVADETVSAPAQFRPVDNDFPPPIDGTVDGWHQVAATIEIADLSQLANGDFRPPWLPSPGWPVAVTSETPLDLRFNTETGTIADAPSGPSTGTVYDIVAQAPPKVEDLSLATATVTPRDPVDLAVPQLRSFAADTFEGADFGWAQVEAIRRRLIDGGAYDSRPTSPAARPGHNLGRLAEFLNDPEAVVGFEEQYAAAAASLLRSEGVPVRVVVGFVIDDDDRANNTEGNTVSVLASDISAWIEVRFDGIGWLPFDVTPPRDRLPEDTPVGRTEREVAVPNPPAEPPPPILPPDLDLAPTPEEESTTEPEEPTPQSFQWKTAAYIGAAALPIVLIVGGLVLVLLLKRRRTRRRRQAPDPSLRIAGAWYEVIDRCREVGAPPSRTATTLETARGLRDADVVDDSEGALLVRLAFHVDQAAFAEEPPDETAADQSWSIADSVEKGVRERSSVLQRWRARLDPRPLMKPDPVQRSLEEDSR